MSAKTVRRNLFLISVWIYPVILFCIFYVAVNFNSFLLAFKSIGSDGTSTFAGFKNFALVFEQFSQSGLVQTALVNSVKMYIICLVVSMPLYIIFAFYIFKRWALGRVFRIIMMIPAIVSGFIMSLVFRRFVEYGIPSLAAILGTNFPQLLSHPDYMFGTTLFYMIWISFSMAMIVYPNAMNAINPEIFESARLDGANSAQELWHIVLPNIYPTLSTFLITGIAGIFTNSGPLVEFYMYSAPPPAVNMGYYIFRETMNNLGTYESYPFIAALGLLFTMISIPLVFGLKHILDKYNPVGE